MKIEYMIEFIKIAETGNYLVASSELYIAQSSLSKHIQSLEQELNVHLFLRTTRKVELSDYGKIFYQYAKEIVSNYSKLEEALLEKKSDESNVFNLGVIPSMDGYDIADILREFKANKDGFKYRIYEDDSVVLLDYLEEGKCSLAFTYNIKEVDDRFNIIPVSSDYLCIVVSKNHPLSKFKKISINELENQRVMILEDHNALKRLTLSSFEKAGIKPEIEYTNKRFLSSYDLNNDDNVAVFLKRDAVYVNNPANTVVDIYPHIKIGLSLIYLKDHVLTKAEKSFIDLINKNI